MSPCYNVRATQAAPTVRKGSTEITVTVIGLAPSCSNSIYVAQVDKGKCH